MPTDHALLLREQGGEASDFAGVCAGLMLGVGRVDAGEQLALPDCFATADRNLDDPSGDFGTDRRVLDRTQRAERALTDFKGSGPDLRGGNQRGWCALLLGRLFPAGRQQQDGKTNQRAAPHAGRTCSPA